jgi:hypothetical protein
MSQIPIENDDDTCSILGCDFVQIDQLDEVPEQEAEAKETSTKKELKLLMANLEVYLAGNNLNYSRIASAN